MLMACMPYSVERLIYIKEDRCGFSSVIGVVCEGADECDQLGCGGVACAEGMLFDPWLDVNFDSGKLSFSKNL